MTVQEKSCRTCAVVKPFEEFGKQDTCKQGRKPVCRDCTNEEARLYRLSLPKGVKYEQDRKAGLRRKFGITVEEYDSMFEAQRGLCAICSKTSDRKLAVDHCHTTSKVRGLLCFKCNTAIGKLNDSPKLVAQALEYLMSHREIGRWKK